MNGPLAIPVILQQNETKVKHWFNWSGELICNRQALKDRASVVFVDPILDHLVDEVLEAVLTSRRRQIADQFVIVAVMMSNDGAGAVSERFETALLHSALVDDPLYLFERGWSHDEFSGHDLIHIGFTFVHVGVVKASKLFKVHSQNSIGDRVLREGLARQLVGSVEGTTI
jgi:hypothetical protein